MFPSLVITMSTEPSYFLENIHTDGIPQKRSSGSLTPPASSVELLVSGALSGAIAKTAIAPMDRVKILFQTDSHRIFSAQNCVKLGREIYARAGIAGFWKGHTATLVRVVPYSATNYFVFARTRELLEVNIGSLVHPIGIKFLAGALSGSCAVCVSYPLETLRARLAVDLDVKYSGGYWQAVMSIARADGLTSLYSGLRPTLIGIIPYAGTSFSVYETLKRENTYCERLAIGAFAGFLAQAATYPLDVVRRRMQVSPVSNPSFLGTLRRIYMDEGIKRGLYKGLSMNAVKGPIAVGISLNANDYMKEYFANRHLP